MDYKGLSALILRANERLLRMLLRMLVYPMNLVKATIESPYPFGVGEEDSPEDVRKSLPQGNLRTGGGIVLRHA